jgi:predicted dithiol-disulfide oxidoreductase (DUF899 family)
MNDTALPPVVTLEEWQQARDALVVKEKRPTHALDALAAERRRHDEYLSDDHAEAA